MRTCWKIDLRRLRNNIESYERNGADGWDFDLLQLIKKQQAFIEELCEDLDDALNRIKALEVPMEGC